MPGDDDVKLQRKSLTMKRLSPGSINKFMLGTVFQCKMFCGTCTGCSWKCCGIHFHAVTLIREHELMRGEKIARKKPLFLCPGHSDALQSNAAEGINQ